MGRNRHGPQEIREAITDRGLRDTMNLSDNHDFGDLCPFLPLCHL